MNQNDFGGILVESGNNEILNNEANTNGGNGIQVDSGSTGNKIHTNLTNFNLVNGISVAGSNNQLFNNTSDENEADGISVTGNGNSVFTAPLGLTLVDGNVGNGIFVSGSQNIIGPGVEAIENGLDGIHLSANSSENQVLKNVVGGHLYSYGNKQHGIHVAGFSNLVKGNTVEDNAESGVYLEGQRHKVVRNSVCHNVTNDINVTTLAENNTVRHNQAAKIVESNPNNLVKNNKRCR